MVSEPFVFMIKKKATIKGGATLWARQTVESEIFYWKPDKWFKIWFYIVNRVNHKKNRLFDRGECFINYKEIMKKCKATKGEVDHCIRWLKSEKSATMIATRKTTRGMIVKVLKYNHFQTLDNYYGDIKSDTIGETRAIQKRYRSDTINKNGKNGKNGKKDIPQNISKNFFNKEKSFNDLLIEFSKALKVPRESLEEEFNHFILYWTEPNKSGSKVRWELERTFDVKRRLYNWFKNKQTWSKENKKRKVI